MAAESWTLIHYDRPWTVNSERGRAGKAGQRGLDGWRERAELTRVWRQVFWGLANEAKVPRLAWIEVEAMPYTRNRVQPDTGACYVAVKAAIDGLKDAGVIDDDSGEFVHSIKLLAPGVHPEGKDCLVVRITGERAA